jgi:hypothetical protein
MVVLCRSFFTPVVIRAIRGQNTEPRTGRPKGERKAPGASKEKLWEAYRNFHSTHLEKVNSKNAMFIMNEFRNTCETIQTFPTERYIRQFLYGKYP